MDNTRLFLLDAYGLIYRAYYALIAAPRITSHGMNTSAVYGFCNTLMELLRKEAPTHIAVCFDPPGGHTFRHDAYPEYKAQRDKQPEDITAALPYIKRILEAYRIPVVEVAGYEADDVIGTLSHQAGAEGFETYMMTLDKDYGQLVNERTYMYRPALRGEGFEIRGPEQICERYSIERPEQVIDILALEGDASDNIPGCPGIGEKTAKTLISAWGSVENLIANVESLKGATRRKIEDNAEQILFSKFLVTIKTDVPLPAGLTPESLRRREPDIEALRAIFRELEFKTLLQRLDAEYGAAAAVRKPVNVQPSLFDFADAEPSAVTPSAVETTTVNASAIASLLSEKTVAVIADAIGEEAMVADFRGLAFSTGAGKALYLPLPRDKAEREPTMKALQSLFSAKVLIVSHDVKRLIILLRRNGVSLMAPTFDTAIAHYLLDPEASHTLPRLVSRYLSRELTGGSGQAQTFGEEADALAALHPILVKEMAAVAEMTALFDNIEMPLVKVLADMEWQGMRVDASELRNLSRLYTERLNAMEAEAFRLAGQPFNIGSPTQVGEILFNKLKLDPKAKRTARGAYSTTEKILEKHRADHPVVDLILKIRKLRKLVATYLDTLPTLVNPDTGRIHTTFNQTATATGRLSSTNPNLQNIPIRTDDGREIRRAFIPDDGCLIMSADYSQIELRLIADFSGDPAMVDAFLHDYDIHRATAAKIYHVALEDVTENQRRNAKTANFGTIYGISPFGLSERLGIPRGEAKELIENYFNTYPDLRDYIDRAVESAREKGYVETVFHRRRLLPDINSRNAVVRGLAERNAVNAPLQGSAADIIKIAMIGIAGELDERGLRSRMIMQVHDELLFNVVPEELETLREIVTRRMETAWTSTVPLRVSVGVGHNWLEAH